MAFMLSPQYGRTALYDAFTNGHLEVVKLLLQSHADVNIKKNVSTESLTSTIHSCKSGKFCISNIIFIAYHN